MEEITRQIRMEVYVSKRIEQKKKIVMILQLMME